MIQEKEIELEDLGEYSDMVQEINAQGQGVLETPNKIVNLNIVKELYANAKPTKEAPLEKVSWVSGRRVSFDRDVIHGYIKDNYVANSRRLDPFAMHLTKGNSDYDEMATSICEAEKTYQLG